MPRDLAHDDAQAMVNRRWGETPAVTVVCSECGESFETRLRGKRMPDTCRKPACRGRAYRRRKKIAAED